MAMRPAQPRIGGEERRVQSLCERNVRRIVRRERRSELPDSGKQVIVRVQFYADAP